MLGVECFAPLDPPSAPQKLTFSATSLTSAVLSWNSPAESLCVTSYRVYLSNITEGYVSYAYDTATNTTSMTVTDLTQGAEYSFTVAGMDAGGRVGDISNSSNSVKLDSEY